MSYETVMEQVKEVPEECLGEVSDFIGYVVYRYKTESLKKTDEKKGGLSKFFGIMDLGDGLEIQKEMRDEWS